MPVSEWATGFTTELKFGWIQPTRFWTKWPRQYSLQDQSKNKKGSAILALPFFIFVNIVPGIYGGAIDRPRIAALTPTVLAVADKGDI
jgi:hypothetical protein